MISIITEDQFETMRIFGLISPKMDVLTFSITAAILTDVDLRGVYRSFHNATEKANGYLMRKDDSVSLYVWQNDRDTCTGMYETAMMLNINSMIILGVDERPNYTSRDYSFHVKTPETFPERGDVRLYDGESTWMKLPLSTEDHNRIVRALE